MLKNTSSDYEFIDLPFDKSIKEVEDSLNIKFNEPDFSKDNYKTFHIKNMYTYNDKDVNVNVEFKNDKLNSVMFSIIIANDNVDNEFSKISTSLTELYGEPTNTMEKTGAVDELNIDDMSTNSKLWKSINNQKTTVLQITMSTIDKANATITLGVGIIN